MTQTSSAYFCPNCSQAVYFQNSGTNAIVCKCGKRLKKEGTFLMVQAFEAVTLADTVIQPGTQGTVHGKKFTVLGRMRAWMEEFVFNYWTIATEDGSLLYLGEGYGIFACYQPIDDPRVRQFSIANQKIGRTINFLDQEYITERKYECYKWEIEGEVLLPDVWSKFLILEMGKIDGTRTELIQGPHDSSYAYSVSYISYSDLQLSNLREAKDNTKTLRCSKCGTQNVVKGFPYAQSFACTNCGDRYSLKEGNSFQSIKENNETDASSRITLGSKGVIRGIEYELVGFTLKEEQNDWQSQWREYTLYNPAQGFAFLSEFDGHWIYIRERGDCPVLPGYDVDRFYFNNEPYQLFNEYSFKTQFAAGCFPYDIFDDYSKTVKEYISPPEVWIMEKSVHEGVIWYFGEHISRRELEKAFGDNIIIPSRYGIGAVQPTGYVNPAKLGAVTLVAMLLLIIIHFISRPSNGDRPIFSQQVNFTDSSNTASWVSNEFHLNKWRSNLQFRIYAWVDNSWFFLNANLVDTRTGTEYNLEKPVEYYHGVDSDGSWSEGGTQEVAYLNQVPAGHYKLQLDGMREGSMFTPSKTTDFNVTVVYDTPNDRNLSYCLIALLAAAVINFLIVRHFEKSRWDNSPFTPYNTEE